MSRRSPTRISHLVLLLCPNYESFHSSQRRLGQLRRLDSLLSDLRAGNQPTNQGMQQSPAFKRWQPLPREPHRVSDLRNCALRRRLGRSGAVLVECLGQLAVQLVPGFCHVPERDCCEPQRQWEHTHVRGKGRIFGSIDNVTLAIFRLVPLRHEGQMRGKVGQDYFG